MTIFQFTVLFLVFIVLVLIAAHFFHRYERAIFWSVALFLFIGVLVLLGTGVLKIIKDGHANSGALFVAFMCLITAGVLVIATQEPESFIRKRRKTISENSSSAPQELEGVVLTRKLDTPLAREVFAKALKEGLMEVKGSHYEWKRSKILLAYMCGRIYCNDSPVPDHGKEGKFMWNPGDDSSFPDFDLNALFQTKDIGQSRNNRKFCPLPNDFDIIDRFFE